MYITNRRTVKDWQKKRESIIGSTDELEWRKAFNDFFWGRVQSRYFEPIQSLRNDDSYHGYGFTIMTLLCSLIEFLESCYEGKTYRQCNTNELDLHEYNRSKQCFIDFLTKREPFSEKFSEVEAIDFYSSVRCGLLHEASTKNGWRIKGMSDSGVDIVCMETKTVYRDDFEAAIKEYIKQYGDELASSRCLQEAFVRKFDALCE